MTDMGGRPSADQRCRSDLTLHCFETVLGTVSERGEDGRLFFWGSYALCTVGQSRDVYFCARWLCYSRSGANSVQISTRVTSPTRSVNLEIVVDLSSVTSKLLGPRSLSLFCGRGVSSTCSLGDISKLKRNSYLLPFCFFLPPPLPPLPFIAFSASMTSAFFVGKTHPGAAVKTSTPSGVINSVSSNWAEPLPSHVAAVHCGVYRRS